ncbi:hypothetical protein [Flavobacterium sp.]|jgi:hypothetical protein|uniref:hypothetical protein n=1 Tax=Flavobacterium sp. TaxID=239 RepID=UPI0022BFE27D|nr:hypothetical protein [Flavobacterium sp.]MCZ8168256.1 hypothetical protein [Flavobacterium sp.]MCZ8295995.1 hypothetical protein [Flavobacterium sp.]
MRKFDITGVHRIMTRYYGSRNMTMITSVEERHFINPSDMKIIFDFDPSIEINFITLIRRIRRYIVGAHFNLNIIEEENKLQIYVIMYDRPRYRDFDFEFSLN